MDTSSDNILEHLYTNPNMNEHTYFNSHKISYICTVCGCYITPVYDLHEHSPHMFKIIDNLYLGAYYNAHNDRELKSFGIKTIVNLAREVPECEFSGIATIKFDWLDQHNFDIKSELDAVLDVIHSRISEPVLVHCRAGVSRSASVVIAYLMKYRDMPFDDAHKHVKMMKPNINPNIGFMKVLKEYKKT